MLPLRVTVRRAGLLACLLVPLATGCGASQPNAAAAKTAADAPEPPLPASAVELLPAAFDSALRVDVAALRGSPLWAYAVEVARKRCIALDRYQVLTERTDLLVGGSQNLPDAPGAAVLQGKLQAGDAEALLGLFAADPAQQPPAQASTRGRFQVLERAPLAASLLGPGLAAAGDPASLGSILDVADGKAPNARQGLLSDGLSQAIGFETAGFALIYRPDDRGRAELERQLGRTGRAALPPGLLQSSRAGLSLGLGDPLELRAAVESASPAEADALTQATMSSLMQLNLLLRLAGLPPLLERVAASTQGTLSVFSLQLSRAELDAVWLRMQDFLAADAAGCGEVKL
jgi:hypothetical protein